MDTWFWILGWFLSVLTITGNGFVIFLIYSRRQLRTKTNMFITSLAVADLCVGAGVIPVMFVYDLTLGSSGYMWQFSLRLLFSYASVMNLCSLVLDRYIAFAKPLKYLTWMTGRHVFQMIFFSWAISFCLATIPFLLYSHSPDMLKVVASFLPPLLEILSCCMLIFCFTSMVIVVYKQGQTAGTLAKQLRFNHRGLTFNKHDKSAVAMMAIVTGLFLICYGIYLRCSLVRLLHIKCRDDSYKIPILVLNSAINPLAYAFYKRDIKKEIKRLMCKHCQRGTSRKTNITTD